MAKKLTKRKGFNFLRSYFDVLNQIPEDKDKLNFLLSIINKQFLDEDPKDLNFIVNLSYESQRHQIETSVKGYKSKTNDLMQYPCQGGTEGACQGGYQDPYLQEEEKEEEKEEEQEKVEQAIPSFEIFKFYALKKSEKLSIAIDLKKLELKYESWKENNWRTGGKNSRKIKNWKTTLLNTLPYLQKEKNFAKKEKEEDAFSIIQQVKKGTYVKSSY